MKTPREKYENDPRYNQLVTTLEMFVENAEFTPSELREACVYACIRCEARRMPKSIIIPDKIEDALNVLEKYTGSKK